MGRHRSRMLRVHPFWRNLVKQLFMALACVLIPAFVFAGAEVGIEKWQEHHPEAAKDLGGWVQTNKDAAHKFFEWDSKHPERSKEFVHWTVDHPAEPIDAFAASHKGWPIFDEIMEHHRPAAEQFMGWARKHADAARALMHHPRGLAWAGKNIYAID